MKGPAIQNKGQNNRPNKQNMNQHQSRPQNKDDLDSREGEEQTTKGNDVTHNKKEGKAGHLKNRGKDKSR